MTKIKPMESIIGGGRGGKLVGNQTTIYRRRHASPLALLAVLCLIGTMYKMAGINTDDAVDIVATTGNDIDTAGEEAGGSQMDGMFSSVENIEEEQNVDEEDGKSNASMKNDVTKEEETKGEETGHQEGKAMTQKSIKKEKAKAKKVHKSESKMKKKNSPFPLPPLSSLLDENGKIKSDVSWLLELIILGFPKSGTTYLEHNLNSDNSYLIHSEQCKLAANKTDILVPILYQEPPNNVNGLIRGIKCPRLLESEYALANTAQYFPNANFIISTRHPVLWFQSFYNFRSYKMHPKFDLTPMDLIGECHREKNTKSPYVCIPDIDGCDKTKTYNVCTNRAQYHHALSRFGKTPMTSKYELDLLDHHDMSVVPSKAKVFLIEISQISDTNETRAKIFRDDLKKFIGISSDLPAMKHESRNQYPDAKRKERFMNICDEQYGPLREILMDHGRKASKWIRKYFLKSPDVFVSSREFLEEQLETWTVDPCDDIEDSS